MKKIGLLILVLLSLQSFSQPQLSDKAEISVLTLGAWQGQLYTAFGHSAFRVVDPVLGIDYAYNYGVFDFDQPNFYLNFARGRNYYMLGVADYARFEYSYVYFNRYIHEQILNLTKSQKQKLFDFLQWNAKPENRSYLYDYFYDNCATKIPEVLETVFEDEVQFHDSHITTNYSIRELTDLYLEKQPWGDLGIDICLGLPMDKKASPYEYMFLPEYVEAGVDNATIEQSGIRVPLVKVKRTIFQPTTEEEFPTLFRPLLVFGLLFLIVVIVSYRDIKRHKLTRYFDPIFFCAVGLIGILLLLLWLATDHQAAANNMNLLWALPTHLFVIPFMVKNATWVGRYFFVIAIICVALLILWPFLPQQLHYALVPLVMSLGLRGYTQYLVRKPAAVS